MSHERREDWDVDILGVRVSAFNMEMALQRLENLVARPTSSYVCVTGVHGIIEAQTDEALREIHNNSAMVTPDGMPTVWSGKWAGAHWMERVYGPDLLLAACEYGLSRGWRHFFYGGASGVAKQLSDSLKERFPSIDIVGSHTPPFRHFDAEFIQLEVLALRELDPDIVWIGLSTPKQERLAAMMSALWHGPVFVGVGAAFDFHSGHKKQAPPILRKCGLEWLFRVASEPRRLGPRYAKILPRFALWNLMRPPRLLPTRRFK